MVSLYTKYLVLNALVISALLGGAATAARAETITFETGSLVADADGFYHLGTSGASFKPPAGGAIALFPGSNFVNGGDSTQVLLVGPTSVQIKLDVPASLLEFNFGGALPVGATVTLNLFNQGQPAGQKTQTVTAGLQMISFTGGPFTSATFQFSQFVQFFFLDNVHFETNRPPTANAGPDQTVAVPHDGNPATNTALVTLDGSGSSDPDAGDTLTYVWKEDAAPVANGVNPAVALEPGDHTLTLVVTDNHGAVSNTDDVLIHVTAELNAPPVASAGADQTVTVSHDGDPSTNTASFTLNGTASDPDSDSVTHEWFQGATSLGTDLSLSLAKAAGTYTFTLKVTDAYGVESTDDVVVKVQPEPNHAPVADAGADHIVEVSGALTPVTVSGSGSDPDGDAVTFAWHEGATPLGSTASLTLNRAPGVYTFTLTVTDSYGSATSDDVNVSVLYSWSGVLAPINADGTSVFKLGRTVPVKFRLTGASAGVTDLAAHLSYAKVAGIEAIGDVNEADSTSAATTGSLFRYDSGSGQYIFNWDTSGLTAGKYKLLIDLGDGFTIDGVPGHPVFLGLR